MKANLLAIASLFLVLGCSKKLNPEKEFHRSLYKAFDHTAENLFSRNIEGPAVDRDGRLFVVNYQKDGTIGLVHPDGKVELFVTLPDKSIGNSIQFNSAGNMLVADFSGHNILEVNEGCGTKLCCFFRSRVKNKKYKSKK